MFVCRYVQMLSAGEEFRRGCHFPGGGITGSCEAHMMLEVNSGPLEESFSLLTAKPSL